MNHPGRSEQSAAEPEITVSVDLSFVQDGRLVRMPLERWLSSAYTRTADLPNQIERLAGEIDALRHAKEQEAHDHVDSAFHQMTQRADSLDQKVAELDSRLDEILAAFNEMVVRGRQTEQDIDHHSFQREFTSLVNQHIGTLVEMIAVRRDLSLRDRALLTSRICWSLFGTESSLRNVLFREIGDEPLDICERADHLYAAAKDLRDRIAGRQNQRWDFGFQAGSYIDTDFQEEWPSPRDAELVDFVVVPSYVFGSYSTLSKQRVYVTADRG